nr:hypothetical protein [uncultured Pseudogulbenkiania sp.]
MAHPERKKRLHGRPVDLARIVGDKAGGGHDGMRAAGRRRSAQGGKKKPGPPLADPDKGPITNIEANLKSEKARRQDSRNSPKSVQRPNQARRGRKRRFTFSA